MRPTCTVSVLLGLTASLKAGPGAGFSSVTPSTSEKPENDCRRQSRENGFLLPPPTPYRPFEVFLEREVVLHSLAA